MVYIEEIWGDNFYDQKVQKATLKVILPPFHRRHTTGSEFGYFFGLALED